MNSGSPAKVPSTLLCFLLALCLLAGVSASAQVVYVLDNFDPAGMGGNSYSGGKITNVWGNWFGSAFQSLAWDAANDASNNAASGALQINLNFNHAGSIPNQFEVYNGASGISPAINGLIYTNFQCDVRFAAGSATTNGTFGFLQFGIDANGAQDYFGGISVPSSNTNWVHVSFSLNAVTDTNLQNISDVLIHIYGPAMTGTSTLWVDNMQFLGGPPPPVDCVVNWTNLHQRIDGFGASSAWNGSWTVAQADLLFSTNLGVVYSDNHGNHYTNNGVALSLLRNRIAPASSPSPSAVPTTVETQIMQWAQARGARVWSTPWTPAAGFKSTNDIYDTNTATGGGLSGGSFMGGTATNLAYASQLANYVASMKNVGVNLYAISIQNEPDAQVNSYDACQWTGAQIHDFVTNLYTALAAQGLSSTKILIAESQNWADYRNLAGPSLTDANVLADVGIVADHNYDGAYGPSTLTKNSYGKALWETEVSGDFDSDTTIANGVYYAQRIYQFMTVAQVNAWHYWWLVNGLLDGNAAPTKRLFTVGNYSRFVRPGYYRVDVANHSSLTMVSAYKDTNAGAFAIVAVNPNPVPVTESFNLTNFTADTVTPWVTSSNLSLASQSPVTVSNASFTYVLPALSVVTFAAQGLIVPSAITISSAVVNPSGPGFVINWNATVGGTYSVFRNNTLGAPTSNWTTLVTGYPFGGAVGGMISYTDAVATLNTNYYRISGPNSGK